METIQGGWRAGLDPKEGTGQSLPRGMWVFKVNRQLVTAGRARGVGDPGG